MNEQIFRIRPYSKRELAGLYFPFTKNADTAVKNLNNLMHRNPDLLAEVPLETKLYRLPTRENVVELKFSGQQ